jgi:hypothetical protein
LLLTVLLVGCATDTEEPGPITLERDDTEDTSGKSDSAGPDVCALAAELPADDICRLACDPDAMAAQLAADGGDPNTCYQLYCALPGDEHVIVGVCLD